MAGNPDFQPIDPSVTPRFAGHATFMRTVGHEISELVDVGLVGVPFDLGVNFRTGARQGPAGVREASRLIRRVHPTSGIKPFEICNVADLGDAPVNPMNKDRSIETIQAFFQQMHDANIVPIACGGDHTIPLPILRALRRRRRPERARPRLSECRGGGRLRPAPRLAPRSDRDDRRGDSGA